MPSRFSARAVYFLAMRRLLPLLVLLPLAACERPPSSEEPTAVIRAPEASAPDAPQEEIARQEETPHEVASPDASARKVSPRAVPAVVHESPDGRAGERSEPTAGPAPWPMAAVPSDPKHEAILQSQRARRLARLDSTRAAPSAVPRSEEVVGTEKRPAEPFQDDVVLPGSVVM